MTEPRERPIPFSTEMVRRILDGSKTQTRRVMKPQPYSNGFIVQNEIICHNDYLPPSALMLDVGRGRNRYTTSDCEQKLAELCPYGVPGDRLWVRETFADVVDGFVYRADMTPEQIAEDRSIRRMAPALVRAVGTGWKPGRFMPRRAARVVLELADVRVQRLQDISEDDARAEGIHRGDNGRFADYPSGQTMPGWDSPIESFRTLWDSINGDREGCDWRSNPFVWALSFARVREQVAEQTRTA